MEPPEYLPEAYACATLAAMAEETDIVVRKATADAEFRAAARIMGTSEPWITLGRTPELIYPNLVFPQLEVWVALAGEEVVGVVTIALPVPLIKGYIGALAVAAGWRGRGIGSKLLRFAEQQIFRKSPNVFLCVSSFNTEAQRFYERHGYARIGQISDFTVAGHGEILLRKTLGPWSTFKPTTEAG